MNNPKFLGFLFCLLVCFYLLKHYVLNLTAVLEVEVVTKTRKYTEIMMGVVYISSMLNRERVGEEKNILNSLIANKNHQKLFRSLLLPRETETSISSGAGIMVDIIDDTEFIISIFTSLSHS